MKMIQRASRILVCTLLMACTGLAASRTHVITLGKWTTVKWPAGDDSRELVDIKIRPVYVDGRVKEFTVGPAHDVTERLLVAQRVFRLNDSLPQENGPNRWRWQEGGWILIDRVSGKVQPVTLPDLDIDNSPVNWVRDYAAYCSATEDGKMFAIIVQLGRRNPLLKKSMPSQANGCPLTRWQRDPARVTFEAVGDPKLTFTVRSSSVDLATDNTSAGED